MNLFLKVVFLVSLAIIFSCNNKGEKSIENQQDVMAEIFPSLIDSMWVEISYSMRPPPVREIYDKKTGRTSYEPIEKDLSLKKEIVEELTENKLKLIQMTIVLDDTVHEIAETNIKELSKHFPSATVDQKKEANITGYKLDFTKYNVNKAFNLVYGSEFIPKNHDVTREYILSKILISRILFDKNKMFGMLTCEYDCGTQCGNGYRIFIKKVNNKWTIDRIEGSWIA